MYAFIAAGRYSYMVVDHLWRNSLGMRKTVELEVTRCFCGEMMHRIERVQVAQGVDQGPSLGPGRVLGFCGGGLVGVFIKCGLSINNNSLTTTSWIRPL